MEKVKNLSDTELREIKRMIGEAFVTNELFHEFGKLEERREFVMCYMDAYVEWVYESGMLYRTKDKKGYIGLASTGEESFNKKLKMLIRLIRGIPFKKLKKLMHHVKQIAGGNERYQNQPHIDILMVCVNKKNQGEGIARKLVEFAKDVAKEKGLPLLFDTDMLEYANMYQHLGCTLYNTITADNGVTRYNLVWEKEYDADRQKYSLSKQ